MVGDAGAAFGLEQHGAAIVLLSQLVALNHRAHRAIENQDALLQESLNRVVIAGHGLLTEK